MKNVSCVLASFLWVIRILTAVQYFTYKCITFLSLKFPLFPIYKVFTFSVEFVWYKMKVHSSILNELHHYHHTHDKSIICYGCLHLSICLSPLVRNIFFLILFLYYHQIWQLVAVTYFAPFVFQHYHPSFVNILRGCILHFFCLWCKKLIIQWYV
jgi:hypothetical protein